jgi:tripartite-type tricarboxylate transporter receptor subunit TctC
MISVRHIAISASLLFATFGSFAQNNTVRLVVPFSTGGPTDIAARVIAPLLSEALGKTVIVDNRVGATGAIGAEFVARAPVNPDPLLTNTCYSFVSDKLVVHVASVHQYDAKDKTFKTVPGSGGVSTAPNELEGVYAWNWAQNIWADSLL